MAWIAIAFPNWYPKRALARKIATRRMWPAPALGEDEYDVAIVGAGIEDVSTR